MIVPLPDLRHLGGELAKIRIQHIVGVTAAVGSFSIISNGATPRLLNRYGREIALPVIRLLRPVGGDGLTYYGNVPQYFTENVAPFDFGKTAANGTPNPFTLTNLAATKYYITVTLTFKDETISGCGDASHGLTAYFDVDPG